MEGGVLFTHTLKQVSCFSFMTSCVTDWKTSKRWGVSFDTGFNA